MLRSLLFSSRGALSSRTLAAISIAALSALVVPGCSSGQGDDGPPYVAPRPRPAMGDASCEGLAKAEPSASWGTDGELALRVGEGGAIEIADASVLGGPFALPFRREAPEGIYAVRVLRVATPLGARKALCVQLRLAPGDITSWSPVGDVVIDTDVLVIADGPHFARAAAPKLALAHAGVEAEASVLEGLSADLREHGLELEHVLPTLSQSVRPREAGDEAAIRDATARLKTRARFVIEPASLGWEVVRAMGERDVATVTLGPNAGETALAVDVARGQGTYVIALGTGAQGAPVALEIRLAP